MQGIADLNNFTRQLTGQLEQLRYGNANVEGTATFILDLLGNTKVQEVDAALAEAVRQLRLENGHLKYVLHTDPTPERALVREVMAGDYRDLSWAASLPSRLAETGWFKRARAALEGSGLSQPSEALAKEAAQ